MTILERLTELEQKYEQLHAGLNEEIGSIRQRLDQLEVVLGVSDPTVPQSMPGQAESVSPNQVLRSR